MKKKPSLTSLKEKPSLKEDLKKINVPFELFTGLAVVIEELEKKEFKYSHYTEEGTSVLVTFKSELLKEDVCINIEKENLLIRQFLITGDTRKLKVIYVVKPSERTFKLL